MWQIFCINNRNRITFGKNFKIKNLMREYFNFGKG
jgi:hypothetical protein